MVGQEQEDEKYIGSQLENLFQALLTQQTLFEQSLSKLSGDGKPSHIKLNFVVKESAKHLLQLKSSYLPF